MKPGLPTACPVPSSGLAALVAIVKPPDPEQSGNFAVYRSPFKVAEYRCILIEREVTAVGVVVGNLLPNQALDVAWTERNNVVGQLATQRAHPALRDAILPCASEHRWV